MIDTIYELLKNKCNDTTSVYMPTYAASQEPNTFYFKANGERSCPSGKIHHHNNNFIVKFDDKTNKIIYICLAPTCEDNKVFTLATFNGTKVVNDYYFDDLGVKNDLDAAQRIYHEYKHWKCCNGILYVFDDKTGLWSNDEITHFSILERFEEIVYYIIKDKHGA